MHADPFFAPFASGQAAALVAAAARQMIRLRLSPEEVLARYAALVRAERGRMNAPADGPYPSRPPRLERCPQCGGRLHGIAVNRTRCTRVGGGYSRLHWCETCYYEEYL